jgi:hypothetical protein
MEFDGYELLTVRDVMAFCHVGRTTAYGIMASIPRVRIPGGLRVRRRDLDAYVERLTLIDTSSDELVG